MHRISFEVIDFRTETDLIRLLDWFTQVNQNQMGYATPKPPKGSKTLARHVLHQMLEAQGKRK